MDIVDKIDNGKYLEMSDEEFQKYLLISGSNSLYDKNIRKSALTVFLVEFLKTYTINDVVKIIVDCVPMGYVARIIIKLRSKIK